MTIKSQADGGGDGKKPEPKPQPARVSSEGQSAVTADDAEPEDVALPLAKSVRPEKKGQERK